MREESRVESVGWRVGTLNIDWMTLKGRELASSMQRIEDRQMFCVFKTAGERATRPGALVRSSNPTIIVWKQREMK